MQTRNTIVGKSEIANTRGGSIMKKKILSMLLAIATVLSLFSMGGISASAATKVTTNKYYTIKNVGANKYLNVYCNSSRNNANLTVWAGDGTSGEDYKFVSCGKGYLIVPRCAPNRAVNIYGDVAKNGSNVCTWAITRHSTQIFIPEYVLSKRGYILRSAYNRNLVLTASGNKNGSNVCVKTYTGSNYQVWTSPAFSEAAVAKKPSSTTSFNKVNYLQWDSRWKSGVYGTTVRYDLRTAGCGILSNVNAVYNLTGKFIQPTELAKWAADNRYYNCDSYGGCPANENFFKNIANKYGSSCGFKYAGRGNSITDQKLISHLKNGGTAVVNVYNHYIAIVGYDAKKGVYQVFDCAPEYNSNGSRNWTGRPTHAGGDWLKANQFTGMMRVTNGYWMYAKK